MTTQNAEKIISSAMTVGTPFYFYDMKLLRQTVAAARAEIGRASCRERV